MALVLISAYLGLADIKFQYDKALHFITFFALTLVFYWVIDTSRKRCINMTLGVCTLIGGIGSEFVQSFVPYREFDSNDIVCNVTGSLIALAMCTWYHKRLAERRRQARYKRLHGGLGGGTTTTTAGDSIGIGNDVNSNHGVSSSSSPLRDVEAQQPDEDTGSILLREIEPEPETNHSK